MYEKLIDNLLTTYDFENKRYAIICVGIPGCGKSTFCKELKNSLTLNVISKDAVRFLFMNYDSSNTAFDINIEEFVALFIQKQVEWLITNTPFNFFSDECNETAAKRILWETMFADKNIEIIYVVFDDFELYRKYMNERRRQVPEAIVAEFRRKFTHPNKKYISAKNFVRKMYE